MGIDFSRLSPSAQDQIMRKLAAQNLERMAQQQKKQSSKYHNTPTPRQTDDGKEIRFDSKKEAERFDELMILLKAGKIKDLKLQPQFTLQEAYTTPDGVRVRAIRYQADFSYERLVTNKYATDGGVNYEYIDEWEKVVEDVKSKATKTRVYGIKKKLMLEKFGIEIREIE